MLSRILLHYNLGLITRKTAEKGALIALLQDKLVDFNKYTEIGK